MAKKQPARKTLVGKFVGVNKRNGAIVRRNSKELGVVSAAADNTKILKRTKNIIKLVVSGVRINGEDRKVKFVAKNQRGGVVICRTKGLPPMRVKRVTDGKLEQFEAHIRGKVDYMKAKTPDQAFARGVKAFWA